MQDFLRFYWNFMSPDQLGDGFCLPSQGHQVTDERGNERTWQGKQRRLSGESHYHDFAEALIEKLEECEESE